MNKLKEIETAVTSFSKTDLAVFDAEISSYLKIILPSYHYISKKLQIIGRFVLVSTIEQSQFK